MRKLTILLALKFGLISCNNNAKKPVDNKPLTEAQQIAIKIAYHLILLKEPSCWYRSKI